MKLEAKQLNFSYQHRELIAGVSLSLSTGETVMLLGPNGSGKSTILKLMAGYLKPQSGTVLLDGIPLAELTPLQRARAIGVVPQIQPPALDFTVQELVMIGRNILLPRFTPPGRADYEAVSKAMIQLEITHLAQRPCNQLSGGERQRVALAAALVRSPALLLLDEPTSALDPAHAIGVMELLKTLPQKPGVLLVTHDLSLAANHAQKLLLLKEGRIYAQGSAEEVLTPPHLREVYGCETEPWHSWNGALQIALLGRTPPSINSL